MILNDGGSIAHGNVHKQLRNPVSHSIIPNIIFRNPYIENSPETCMYTYTGRCKTH